MTVNRDAIPAFGVAGLLASGIFISYFSMCWLPLCCLYSRLPDYLGNGHGLGLVNLRSAPEFGHGRTGSGPFLTKEIIPQLGRPHASPETGIKGSGRVSWHLLMAL
jgi:hypothetical protein